MDDTISAAASSRQWYTEPTPGHYALFDRLTAFYIKGRYTEYKRKQSALLNREDAEGILRQTKEVFAWLLTLKP